MAYDGAHVMLFGGSPATFGNTTGLGDTWVFNGDDWTELVEGQAPPPRAFPAFARLDSRMVLFGGAGYEGALNDTWIFDGGHWSELPTANARGPSPRYSAAMAALDKHVVLFGGQNHAVAFNDTWVFDGSGWTELQIHPSPAARWSSAMASDGHQIVLFSGRDQSADFDDTWAFDGVTWTRMLDNGPHPDARSGSAMAYDGKRLVLFGGQPLRSQTWPQETWAFAGGVWEKLQTLHNPWGLTSPSMANDGKHLVIFGGQTDGGPMSSDTWIFSGTNWSFLWPAPQLGRAEFQTGQGQSWSLQLSWTLANLMPPYTVKMQLFADPQFQEGIGASVTAETAASGSWSPVAAGVTVDLRSTHRCYWIAVAVESDHDHPARYSPWSNPLPIFFAEPRLLSVTFDGRWLDVGCVLPPKPIAAPPGEYRFTLIDASGTTLDLSDAAHGFPSAQHDSTLDRLDLSSLPLTLLKAPLELSLGWAWTDPALPAAARLASATAPVYGVPPGITSTAFGAEPGDGTVQWALEVLDQTYRAEAAQFRASVFAAGTLCFGPTLLEGTQDPRGKVRVVLSVPKTALPVGPELTVTLAKADMVSSGPVGAAAPLVVEAPSIIKAAYAPGTLAVTVGSRRSTPSGSTWLRVCQGNTILAETFVFGPAGELPLQAEDGQSYTLIAARVCGVAIGPTATLELITSGCEATATMTSPRSVELTWTKPEGGTEVTGFEPVIGWEDVEVPLAVQGPDQTSATLALPDTLPTVAWIAVRALRSQVQGPIGERVPLLSAAPSGLRLAADLYGRAFLASWDISADSRVEGYVVSWTLNEEKRTTRVTSNTSSTEVRGAQTVLDVAVAAIGRHATGVSTLPVLGVQHVPRINTASFEGRELTLTWEPTGDIRVPDVTSYHALVLNDGHEIMSRTVFGAGDSSGILTVPPRAHYVVVVAANATATGMWWRNPAGPASFIPSDFQSVTTVRFSVEDATLTITWPAAWTADNYDVTLESELLAPEQATVRTCTYTLTRDQFPPQGIYGFRVRAVVGDDPFSRMPAAWSSPINVYLLPPSGVTTRYDGETARVAWDPLTVPGVTGYRVTFLGGKTGPQTVTAASSSADMVIPFDAGSTMSVVVQAVFVDGVGQPTTAVPLFAPGWFLSVDASKPPALVPVRTPKHVPAAGTNSTGEDIVVPLPDIFASQQRLPTPAGSFTLEENRDPSTKVRFPFLLTIPTSSLAWTFGAEPVRVALQSAYVLFLKSAEQCGATPAGIATLQEAIARSMPQTFQETLYYAYGLDLARGCIDLRPGMVLRMALDMYVDVGQPPTSEWLSGYTGGAVVDDDISSYVDPSSGWRVGFDPFIAQLVVGGALQVSAPLSSAPQQTEAGVADTADLFYPAFRQPFYRLFFPAQLQSPTGVGQVQTQDNFMIAAAPTYSALTATVSSPMASNAVAYFRGRAIARACIRIVVNGAEEVVPIGTTLGNILDRYGLRPPTTSQMLQGLVLQRASGAVLADMNEPYRVGRSSAVRLDWGTRLLYAAAQDALTLPMLHGDRLTIE